MLADPTTRKGLRILLACASLVVGCGEDKPLEARSHYQGEIAGEATPTSIILRARLTATGELVDGDVTGRAGDAAFEVAKSRDFEGSRIGPWITAKAADDFVIQQLVDGLQPGGTYYFRLRTKLDGGGVALGPTGRFVLPFGADGDREVDLAIVTCMNQYKFLNDPTETRADKTQGYPALKAIVGLEPDYFIATGDNVYYDPAPDAPIADTEPTMRRLWHTQFAMPRFEELFRSMSTYWEKDDHDYRYNNADSFGTVPPLPALGARIFLEQVPVVDPAARRAPTYRTHRLTRDLQIWLLESREHRSKNDDDEDPAKSLWGKEQLAWLERTLLESDATFKLLISPTPLVGPDITVAAGFRLPNQKDDLMRDNHTNPAGFRREGEEFFAWARRNGLSSPNLLIACGDRHWKYHSIRPDGFEEFSCGTLVHGNARLGPKPGDPRSTDPQSLIRQPFRETKKDGGFMIVRVRPAKGGEGASAEVTWYDDHGAKLYSVTRRAERRRG